jgi:plastocyanin
MQSIAPRTRAASELNDGGREMRRFLIMAATLALLVTAAGGAAMTQAFGVVGRGGGHSMDMSDQKGMGSKHDKNARVVPGAREIEVEASSFAFTPDTISVGAGEDVTIVLHSTGVRHDLMVKGKGHIVGAKKNKTARGGLELKQPGTYAIWCSEPGHRGAGMRGTIVVT